MMSVLEYAEDVGKNAEAIIKKCKQLGINVNSKNDMLSEDDIIELDNSLDDIEELEEEERLVVESENTGKQVSAKMKTETRSNKVPKVNKKDLANKKKEMYKNKEKLISNNPLSTEKIVVYKDNMTINDLAHAMNVPASDLIRKLFSLGILATLNSHLNFDQAEILVSDYGKELKTEDVTDVNNFESFEIVDDEKDLVKRPPVVTIMGHVDHGKTTLLDTIRKTNVALGEAGGITQAISAYQVKYNGETITFIDTPGHAAFTEMRARGAQMTDIVIIIVAADDGVMPQTKEAIDHALAAKVPIIVAINKIDKPGANPSKIMTDLTEYGLTPEIWGGNTLYNEISAKNGDGIDKLLENILLVAELENYKANPNRYAAGTVVESRLDQKVGPIVTLLIQNGTLRLGDPIVVGTTYGKVRTLKNDLGEEIMSALPSQPVEITGLNEVPQAGDKFMAFETEKEARNIASNRREQSKAQANAGATALTLDALFSKIQEGAKEINVLVKADVNGSSEAVKNALEKIEVEGVKVNVIRSSVGAINESDVVLAKASNAIIIGFNVRPDNKIKESAKDSGVEIRLYNIIYKAVEEMEAAMQGMLDPVFEERVSGTAEVRQLFKFSKVGTIAGSYVTDGTIKKDCKVRIIRDGIVIYDGNVNSIQREKDSVKEVKKGLECGITIENYSDLKVGDTLEFYEMVEIKK